MQDWSEKFASRAHRMQASEIRELLKLLDQPDIISFAGGIPDPRLFPSDAFAQAYSEVLSGQDAGGALQYSVSEGYLPLREWLAAHMRGARHRLHGRQYSGHLRVAAGTGLSRQTVPVAR